jgi:8-oxo-dGTP diphosphatase
MLPLRFTLCFLTRGDQVLMLHRVKAPNRGLWNGVGGRIEPGEAPLDSCLREVREETGFTLPGAHFAGLLTWNGFEIDDGGLYLFTAPAPAGDPVQSSEGALAWQPRSWVFSSPEVVENIHYFAPAVLARTPPQVYHFEYRGHTILGHQVKPLPAWVDITRPSAPAGRLNSD